MSNKAIGEITCPLCRSHKAKVSISKSGLAVATCHRCHMQMFTRSDISDGAMRMQVRPFADVTMGAVDVAAVAGVVPDVIEDKKPAWLQW